MLSLELLFASAAATMDPAVVVLPPVIVNLAFNPLVILGHEAQNVITLCCLWRECGAHFPDPKGDIGGAIPGDTELYRSATRCGIDRD